MTSVSGADLAHLLRRTEFVARPSRLAELTGRSLEDVVDDVLRVELNPSDANDPPTFVDSQGKTSIRTDALINWWLDRMVSVPRPLAERVTLFWHGHFTSALEKVPRPFFMLGQNRTYRRLGLGDYLQLARAMAIEPAMLDYLDNRKNVKATPNQNFARELMELFLLGVGNYTENDVESMSRAWTGHTIDPNTGAYVFNSATHDYGSKVLFGVSRSWDGPEAIDHIVRDDPTLRLIAARHISRKLWEFLAHPSPSTTLVDELATSFLSGGRNIRTLIRTILLRPEFYSASAKKGLVRTPIEFVVAAVSAGGLPIVDVNPAWRMEAMGQVPFDPPNVSGWKQNSYWINSSAWSERLSYGLQVAWRMVEKGRYSGSGLSPDEAVNRVAEMLGLVLEPGTRAALRDLVIDERTRASAGGNGENVSLLASAFNSPEFHLA